MQKEVREVLRIRFKLMVLEYARGIGSATKACREFKVPRSTFYNWKRAFDKEGKAGLARKKPIAINHPRSLKQDVVDQILDLRQTYKLGCKLQGEFSLIMRRIILLTESSYILRTLRIQD